MRTPLSRLIPVLVSCSLALGVACEGERTATHPAAVQGRQRPPAPPAAALAAPGVAAQAGPAPSAPEPRVEDTNELRPQAREVKVGQPAAPPAGRNLLDRERRLADREAALAARERGLEQRDEASRTDPAPPPAPTAGAASGAAAEEPASEPALPPQGEAQPAPVAAVNVAAGTAFEVEFAKGLASNTSSVGDTFRTRVISDVLQNGTVAIPAGAEILGVVTDAAGVQRIGGRAKLGLNFTDLVLPSGATIPIHASFLQQGKSNAGKDAATIGGTTAGGAILGRILGGNRGKGTLIGAIIGAAAGTAIASRSAGEEVVIPEGSVVHIQLTDPIDFHPR